MLAQAKTGMMKKKIGLGETLKKDWRKNKVAYLIVLPVLIYYILFHYKPIYGAIIAFENFRPSDGIMGSEWVGLEHFINFFKSRSFWTVLKNTFSISLSSILFGFPAPIIFALLLNEMTNKKMAGAIKTISYMPYFISLVVICAMIKTFVAGDGLIGGAVNSLLGTKGSLLDRPNCFVPIYIISNIWQGVGWDSIIYVAALSGVSMELYEAAEIDGCGRWNKMRYVSLPGIATTIIIMFILKVGGMLSVGYEKIILLYNPLTYETADVINSYVYRKGIQEFNYSYSTAVGLFNSVVNFLLLIIANSVSKKVSDTGIM